MAHTPLVLMILDGWGHRELSQDNPIHASPTPTMDRLYALCPKIELSASGSAVGLPEGQMGNSEVGHMHIGAGRAVPQDLTRIHQAIEQGDFFKNPVLLDAVATAQRHDSTVHVMGLLSPGGVHSHQDHLEALLKFLEERGVRHCLHAFLDGRDVPPKSAAASLERADRYLQASSYGALASMAGRYYAMDRDQNWERMAKVWAMFLDPRQALQAKNALVALQASYDRGESDEFVRPTVLDAHPLVDNDVVIMMNFRADRMRQLLQVLMAQAAPLVHLPQGPALATCVTLTQYDENSGAGVLYAPDVLEQTLGACLSEQGYRQLRIAETEKYAHVTYFFNGGREQPFPGEVHQMIPSPKVATYNLQPQMSAPELTDALVKAITSQSFDVVICNYANADMVGHTGDFAAAKEAVAVIDACLARVLTALDQVGGEIIVTADHGNIECMYDEINLQPHTAHTNNLVPFLYRGRAAHAVVCEGALQDIAPTVLYLLGEKIPEQMTGRVLVLWPY